MEQIFEQSLPWAPFIFGFLILLLLSSVLQKKLRRRELIRQGQLPSEGTQVPSLEKRVAANSAWSKGEIRSEGRGPMIALWILALVWNLTFGVSFFNSLSNPDMKTGGMVVLGVFALLGIIPVGFAVYFSIRHFRFGHSVCCIHGKAGVLGKKMTGNIRTKKEIQANGDYKITLQCLESYSVGSGKNRRTETTIRLEEKQIVPRAGQNSRAGIPFSFRLPQYPPETGYQLARGKITWCLRIDAPLEGVDYSAMFIIPVFQME